MENTSREAILQGLAKSPLMIENSDRESLKRGAGVGFVLGSMLAMLGAVAISTFTTLGKAWALSIGAAFLVLCVAAGAMSAYRNSRGYRIVCDEAGVQLLRHGERRWAVPWGALVFERYGPLGSRLRIVLPDGSRAPFVDVIHGSLEEMKAFNSVIAAFEVDVPPSRISWVRIAIVCVIGLAVAVPTGLLGYDLISGVLDDPVRETAPTLIELLPGIGAIVVAGLGVSTLLIASLLLISKLESGQLRSKGSEHGPLWIDYVRRHFQSVPAVVLEPGRRYRYLDPRRLKGHIGNGVGLIVLASLFFGATLLMPAVPPNVAIVWGMRIGSFLLIFAPIGLARKEKGLSASLAYEYWVEGDRLYVKSDDRVESFDRVPVRTKRGSPEKREQKFMTWWEEFENERGRIRVDRRFLWPQD